MKKPENDMFRHRTADIVWSTDVVDFLQGAETDREFAIRNAADALHMTLRVWLAGAASNSSLGPG